MKIYLDMCSLQRPLDTKTQVRVAMEAEAILSILALCASGYATLLASDALVFETAQNPHPIRKQYAFGVLAMATEPEKFGDNYLWSASFTRLEHSFADHFEASSEVCAVDQFSRKAIPGGLVQQRAASELALGGS